MLLLNCWVLGEDSTRIFPVKIDRDENVGCLKLAIKEVKKVAFEHIDADRLGAFGHSSGAQLAALLGMQDTRDNSDPALAKYSSRVQAAACGNQI